MIVSLEHVVNFLEAGLQYNYSSSKHPHTSNYKPLQEWTSPTVSAFIILAIDIGNQQINVKHIGNQQFNVKHKYAFTAPPFHYTVFHIK